MEKKTWEKDANELLKQATNELSNIRQGEVFLVKSLFKGYEWDRIKISVRLKLGILFINEVITRRELGIEVVEKTSSNQQKYKKIF